jgi:hypothetical protein
MRSERDGWHASRGFPETIESYISVFLFADLFGAEPEDVAADVIRERRKAGLPVGEADAD